MSLSNQRIVVIGGSSGIGYAVAEAALADGADVVIGSSQAANVEAATGKLGDRASGHPIDVRAEADVAIFFEKVGPFDHLVFTAGDWGGRSPRHITETDLERAAAAFDVRYWGALRAIKQGQPLIREGGSIALTNGLVAHRPRKGAPNSTAMAGALEHLTRGLAVDLAPIRVNIVCPGLIRTEVWNSIAAEGREEQFKQMTARQPLPRIGEPAEVAEAYLYLLRAGYTTGQVMHVDGGASII